jgi:hypothetical protein
MGWVGRWVSRRSRSPADCEASASSNALPPRPSARSATGPESAWTSRADGTAGSGITGSFELVATVFRSLWFVSRSRKLTFFATPPFPGRPVLAPLTASVYRSMLCILRLILISRDGTRQRARCQAETCVRAQRRGSKRVRVGTGKSVAFSTGLLTRPSSGPPDAPQPASTSRCQRAASLPGPRGLAIQ